jgi:hypothetical protein
VKALLIALLLAATTAFAEPQPSTQEKCVLNMTTPLSVIYQQYVGGLHPAMIEQLIATEPKYGWAGRWMLTEALRDMELAVAVSGKTPTLSQFISKSLDLCEAKKADGDIPGLPLPEPERWAIKKEWRDI